MFRSNLKYATNWSCMWVPGEPLNKYYIWRLAEDTPWCQPPTPFYGEALSDFDDGSPNAFSWRFRVCILAIRTGDSEQQKRALRALRRICDGLWQLRRVSLEHSRAEEISRSRYQQIWENLRPWQLWFLIPDLIRVVESRNTNCDALRIIEFLSLSGEFEVDEFGKAFISRALEAFTNRISAAKQKDYLASELTQRISSAPGERINRSEFKDEPNLYQLLCFLLNRFFRESESFFLSMNEVCNIDVSLLKHLFYRALRDTNRAEFVHLHACWADHELLAQILISRFHINYSPAQDEEIREHVEILEKMAELTSIATGVSSAQYERVHELLARIIGEPTSMTHIAIVLGRVSLRAQHEYLKWAMGRFAFENGIDPLVIMSVQGFESVLDRLSIKSRLILGSCLQYYTKPWQIAPTTRLKFEPRCNRFEFHADGANIEKYALSSMLAGTSFYINCKKVRGMWPSLFGFYFEDLERAFKSQLFDKSDQAWLATACLVSESKLPIEVLRYLSPKVFEELENFAARILQVNRRTTYEPNMLVDAALFETFQKGTCDRAYKVGHFFSSIMFTMKNLVRQETGWKRTEKRTPFDSDKVVRDDFDHELNIIQGESLETIRTTISNLLTSDEFALLIEHFVEQRSQREIAIDGRTTIEAVKSKLKRTKDKLRRSVTLQELVDDFFELASN